jgi:hypothetical protein
VQCVSYTLLAERCKNRPSEVGSPPCEDLLPTVNCDSFGKSDTTASLETCGQETATPIIFLKSVSSTRRYKTQKPQFTWWTPLNHNGRRWVSEVTDSAWIGSFVFLKWFCGFVLWLKGGKHFRKFLSSSVKRSQQLGITSSRLTHVCVALL